MLVRDVSDNMFHIFSFETCAKRSKTYHALCGKTFPHVPNVRPVADEYTRCPECRAIMKARTGMPVARSLNVKENT